MRQVDMAFLAQRVLNGGQPWSVDQEKGGDQAPNGDVHADGSSE
jgi:hypothetical protein